MDNEYSFKRSERDYDGKPVKKRRDQEAEVSPGNSIVNMFDGSPEKTRNRRAALWGVDDNNAEGSQLMIDSNAPSRPRTMMSVRPVTAGPSDDYVQMIPDIDDVHDDDFVQQMADAPNVQFNQIVSFQELEKDSLKISMLSNLDGINLSSLVKHLVLQSETKEDDKVWTWDNLISDVVSKLPDLDSKSNFT